MSLLDFFRSLQGIYYATVYVAGELSFAMFTYDFVQGYAGLDKRCNLSMGGSKISMRIVNGNEIWMDIYLVGNFVNNHE